jgi:ABC-type Fe2+-enterobactin transport system substrate-binding protein
VNANEMSDQTNQTVDTLKQEVALLCAEKKGEVINQTKSQTSREKLLAECGLEMPKLDEKNASNVIRDYIISLGLNPAEME